MREKEDTISVDSIALNILYALCSCSIYFVELYCLTYIAY